MSFPFHFQGRLEIAVPAEMAQRVSAGIERWLSQSHGENLRWEGDTLHFSVCGTVSLMRPSPHPLSGIDCGEITFTPLPGRVVIAYHLSLKLFGVILGIAWISLIGITPGVKDPRLWLLLPLAPLAVYVIWATKAYGFRNHLKLVLSRELANAAEEDLRTLQSQLPIHAR